MMTKPQVKSFDDMIETLETGAPGAGAPTRDLVERYSLYHIVDLAEESRV